MFTKRIDRDGFMWPRLCKPVVLLHALLRYMAAVVQHRDGEIERLQTIIKQLQRTQFGRHSGAPRSRLARPRLEDLDRNIGRAKASNPHADVEIADKGPWRKPLADHLPREEIVIDVAYDAGPRSNHHNKDGRLVGRAEKRTKAEGDQNASPHRRSDCQIGS